MDAGQSRSDQALASIPQAAINSEGMEQGMAAVGEGGVGPRSGAGTAGDRRLWRAGVTHGSKLD